MAEHTTRKFPRSRIATLDIAAVGRQKHHVISMLEIDVTTSRRKIREHRPDLSFTAWLIKVISHTLQDYAQAAAYLKGKREVVIFKDINVSVIVEKELNGRRVPIPLVIEKAQDRSVDDITRQIRDAQQKPLTDQDVVLQRRSGRLERLYYHLPGFLRRAFWRYLLRRPHLAYSKMGNVAVTSIGMMGNVNGWFIPITVHPLCFGISRAAKKPVVIDDRIEIREVLNLTVMLDHDVIDGAPMARFIGALAENMEKEEMIGD